MQRKNVFSLQLNVCFTQTCNVWKFAMCKKCILSQLLKSIFCPRTLVKLRQGKIIKLQNRLLLPQCNITFCAINLFLLPFRSHCSTQNIGFSNSGYIIKPPQPSSTIYGALPFTGNRRFALFLSWEHCCFMPDSSPAHVHIVSAT